MDPQDNKQLDQYKNQVLEQAVAFEEMIRSKGWEFVKAYYQTRVQELANGLLLTDKSIAEFENERQQVIGLRNLIGFVDDALNLLKNERSKSTTTTGE